MIRENGLGEQRPIAGLRLELEGDGCTQLIGAFDTLDEAVDAVCDLFNVGARIAPGARFVVVDDETGEVTPLPVPAL